MSLHGRCVTQDPDPLRKITSVIGREKLPQPEVLDFPLCSLPSVGEFSCGQLGCRAAAICARSDLLAAKQLSIACTDSGFLYFFLLSSFSLQDLFLPSSLCIGFHLSLALLPPSCSHWCSLSLSLPRYLSICQGANVGLQMKQLPSQATRDRYVLLSIRQDTLCLSDALTREAAQGNETS